MQINFVCLTGFKLLGPMKGNPVNDGDLSNS